MQYIYYLSLQNRYRGQNEYLHLRGRNINIILLFETLYRNNYKLSRSTHVYKHNIIYNIWFPYWIRKTIFLFPTEEPLFSYFLLKTAPSSYTTFSPHSDLLRDGFRRYTIGIIRNLLRAIMLNTYTVICTPQFNEICVNIRAHTFPAVV